MYLLVYNMWYDIIEKGKKNQWSICCTGVPLYHGDLYIYSNVVWLDIFLINLCFY